MSKKSRSAGSQSRSVSAQDIVRWLRRAREQLQQGDFAGVVASAQRVAHSPFAGPLQRAEAYDHMGPAYMMQQEFDAGYAALTAALDLAPNDGYLWYNRALACRFTMRS